MPNCPSCDDVEMIETAHETRTCPLCGYSEPHESTRPNRAARRAQKREQRAPRPRQQRRAAEEERQRALFETLEDVRAQNPGKIVVIDELSMHHPGPAGPEDDQS